MVQNQSAFDSYEKVADPKAGETDEFRSRKM